jgi:hypothetical protein
MKICLSMFVLAVMGGSALAQPAKTYARNPTGEGDPAAVTCRLPMELSGTRKLGPEVCKSNAEWAQYAKDGMMVSPDGRYDLPAKKGVSCQVSAGTGGGTSNAQTVTSTIKCDY